MQGLALHRFRRFTNTGAGSRRCRGSLYNWYEEYLANDGDIPDANPCRHYSEGLKRVAVDHYFEHGKRLARTRRALGYPSKELLAAWNDEPGARQAEGEPDPPRL